MISDEPDEDADSLDDENLVDTYLSPAVPSQQAETAVALKMTDWPTWRDARSTRSLGGTWPAWFKSNHGDWREGMEFVLRAWVAARSRSRTPAPPPV